jgi:hypothetical protein
MFNCEAERLPTETYHRELMFEVGEHVKDAFGKNELGVESRCVESGRMMCRFVRIVRRMMGWCIFGDGVM